MLEVEELEAKLPQYQQQLQGLDQLKTNAQQLIDNQNSLDINLNVNVNATSTDGSSTVYRESTDVRHAAPVVTL